MWKSNIIILKPAPIRNSCCKKTEKYSVQKELCTEYFTVPDTGDKRKNDPVRLPAIGERCGYTGAYSGGTGGEICILRGGLREKAFHLRVESRQEDGQDPVRVSQKTESGCRGAEGC